MAEAARQLDPKLKTGCRLIRQSGKHLRGWRPVKSEIELNQREFARVVTKHAAGRRSDGIKVTDPVGIRVSRCSHPYFHNARRGPRSEITLKLLPHSTRVEAWRDV